MVAAGGVAAIALVMANNLPHYPGERLTADNVGIVSVMAELARPWWKKIMKIMAVRWYRHSPHENGDLRNENKTSDATLNWDGG